ncbi:hypothetical protein IHE45_20G007800 [Dioscorea alata]|uniref:Uncharacterized protein n=1 Tax=Dioscorea alata TaxID=55571 RepID=A0ACB7TNS9_DIOAL|nr:hypothetical protein IHE45_20G007800 [Dioscorea alata]
MLKYHLVHGLLVIEFMNLEFFILALLLNISTLLMTCSFAVPRLTKSHHHNTILLVFRCFSTQIRDFGEFIVKDREG